MSEHEYHVWRVTNGRVTIIGRDGKEHRYAPGDDFVCDAHQLRWRREQVQYLRPAEEQKAQDPEPAAEEQKAQDPEPAAEAPAGDDPEGDDSGEPHDPDGVLSEDPGEQQHTVYHRGGGWWDVYDGDGNRLTDRPLREQEARRLAGLE